jgi:hypothetical protein
VKKAIALATVTLVLVFASVALAGGSSLLSGYGGQEALGSHASGTAAPPAKSSTLPFTGVDLLPIVAGGLALVLAGSVVRRSARRKS